MHTLFEIGNMMEPPISRKRVAQLETRAFRKLGIEGVRIVKQPNGMVIEDKSLRLHMVEENPPIIALIKRLIEERSAKPGELTNEPPPMSQFKEVDTCTA